MSEPPYVFTVAARDGTPLWFRQVVPDDRDLLVRGYRDLSDESRYRRFHALYDELTEEQLRFLAELDYHDQFAWGVMIGYPPYLEAAAIGRYAKYQRPASDGKVVADVGITVLDKFQGNGIGTALVDALIITAHANHIARFETLVLAENEPMLGVFRRRGARFGPLEYGTVEVVVDIEACIPALQGHPLLMLVERGRSLEPPADTEEG